MCWSYAARFLRGIGRWCNASHLYARRRIAVTTSFTTRNGWYQRSLTDGWHRAVPHNSECADLAVVSVLYVQPVSCVRTFVDGHCAEFNMYCMLYARRLKIRQFAAYQRSRRLGRLFFFFFNVTVVMLMKQSPLVDTPTLFATDFQADLGLLLSLASVSVSGKSSKRLHSGRRCSPAIFLWFWFCLVALTYAGQSSPLAAAIWQKHRSSNLFYLFKTTTLMPL